MSKLDNPELLYCQILFTALQYSLAFLSCWCEMPQGITNFCQGSNFEVSFERVDLSICPEMLVDRHQGSE